MKLSQLIKELQAIRARHPDMEVRFHHYHPESGNHWATVPKGVLIEEGNIRLPFEGEVKSTGRTLKLY
jgi:hypothetical protein